MERYAARGLAALEQQRQLAHGEPQLAAVAPLPRRRKATLLESLREDAQAGPVPVQDLGSPAVLRHEEEEIAREHVAAKPLGHQKRQRVEALPHVRRRGEGVHRHLPRRADHASRRRRSATPATSSPSMRTPPGPCTTIRGGSASTDTGTNRGLVSAFASASAG